MSGILKDEEDAYGHEISSFYSGEEGYEIIERDDGYFDVSDGPYPYFERYEGWPEIERNAIKLAKGNVLDAGSGAGRICLYLQENGLKCTGIDNSPNAIKTATERGVKDALLIPFEKVDELSRTFDTVIMFGNNFGLFKSRSNAKKMLDLLYSVTSKDAVILAESLDPYQTDMKEHHDYHALNLSRGRMAGELRIRVRFRKYVTPWFDYLLVSREEMKGIVNETNWYISDFFSGDGPLYVAVIRKKL